MIALCRGRALASRAARRRHADGRGVLLRASHRRRRAVPRSPVGSGYADHWERRRGHVPSEPAAGGAEMRADPPEADDESSTTIGTSTVPMPRRLRGRRYRTRITRDAERYGHPPRSSSRARRASSGSSSGSVRQPPTESMPRCRRPIARLPAAPTTSRASRRAGSPSSCPRPTRSRAINYVERDPPAPATCGSSPAPIAMRLAIGWASTTGDRVPRRGDAGSRPNGCTSSSGRHARQPPTQRMTSTQLDCRPADPAEDGRSRLVDAQSTPRRIPRPGVAPVCSRHRDDERRR